MKIKLLILFNSFLLLSLGHYNHKVSSPRILAKSGDVTLPTSYQIFSSAITVYFNFETNNTATIAIECNIPNQFFGVGIGLSMNDADIWYFEISGATVTFYDAHSSSQSTPAVDLNNLIILGYDIQATKTIVKFSRALNTGDPNDKVLSQGSTNMIWATSASQTLVQHSGSSRGQVIADLTNGATGHAQAGLIDAFKQTHGILLVVAWAFIFDISLIIVRYNKALGRPPFQILHSITMWMTFIISTVSVAIMVDRWRAVGSPITYHGIIGLAVLGLSGLSLLGGIGSILGVKGKKPNRAAIEGRKHHGFTGYLLWALTRAELIIGCYITGDTWLIVVCTWLALVFLLHILITFLQKRNQYQYVPIDDSTWKRLNAAQEQLVTAINEGYSHEDLIAKFPKIRWVLYGNYIIDVTNYLHPGGVFIFEIVNGREVTQFLRGAFTTEKSIPSMAPHTHSKDAFKFIKSAIIGKINNRQSALVDEYGRDIQSNFHDQWRVVNKEILSPILSRFDFVSQKFAIRGLIGSIDGFGRHFTIQAKNKLPARTYTTALGLTKESNALRDTVFNALISGGNIDISALKVPKNVALPLFIRKYNFTKGLSKALYEIDINNPAETEFQIEGPSGQGINLRPTSKGLYVILCAGTGVLPFIDLLNYLFYKTAYEVLKEKGKNNEAEAILNLGFDFDKSFQGVSFKLVGAFASPQDTFGLDIIKNLSVLSKKFDKNVFEAALTSIRNDDENIQSISGRFDSKLLSKIVRADANAYFVCGPPAFNKTVPDELNKMGVPSSKIVYV